MPNDPTRRDKINGDIGSWCGIFATYCYRAAGLKITWEQVRSQSTIHFTSLRANEAVRKGDIGVMTPGLSHHFVVIEDAEPGARVYSIDGNVGNPSEMTVSPWNSVISKRFYLRNTLATKSAKVPAAEVRRIQIGTLKDWLGLPRSESLSVSSAEPNAVALLIVFARAHAAVVASIGRLELALTLEVPLAAIDGAIFLASLPAVRDALVRVPRDRPEIR